MDPVSGRPPRHALLWSIAIFVASVGGMAWLRLGVYPDAMLTLGYGLPLLLCLWHRDRRLLWAMGVSLMAMSVYKAFVLRPPTPPPGELAQWLMQLANMLVVGWTVDRLIVKRRRLDAVTAALTTANAELRASEAEVAAQNEELRQQGEELQQHNEELQQQREELDLQAEELRMRTEELHFANAELAHRAKMLEALLAALPNPEDERAALQAACTSLLGLLGGDAVACVVLTREQDLLRLRAGAGARGIADRVVPLEGTFAAIVMAEGRPAYIDDLSARPDLGVPGLPYRTGSLLAAPVYAGGVACGVVEAYSAHPQHWTKEAFRVATWVAAQCSLLLEVRHLHDRLAAANAGLEAEVEARTAELRQIVSELEHFSYTITHDMRAPLRAMHGFARLLLTDGGALTPEQRADFLQRIVTAAARLDRLILDSLDYSRSGMRQEMRVEAIDPEKLLRGMLASYPDLQADQAHIAIDGELPLVLANEAGLTQCFSNLLSNALKFVRPGDAPRVRVWAERRDPQVRIWVEDHGIGVPEEMRTRIFGLFQRASRAYEGTGLGLALVKKMAERMGGRVGVESEPGQGARFWLELRGAEQT